MFLAVPLGVACLLLTCEREDRLLIGSWQASRITEGGDSLHIDPTEVGFVFRPNNRYAFRSTLRYREAGTWRLDNGYLFARDTTQPVNEERVVAVEKLTVDSLVIRMQRDSAERLMTLLRTSPPPE